MQLGSYMLKLLWLKMHILILLFFIACFFGNYLSKWDSSCLPFVIMIMQLTDKMCFKLYSP